MKQACFYTANNLHEKEQFNLPVRQSKNMQFSNFCKSYPLQKGKYFILYLVFSFFLIHPVVLNAQTATPPSTGDGSLGNPYQISTLNNLYWLANQVNSGTNYSGVFFKQTVDINATSTSSWFSNGSGGYYGWTPIAGAVLDFSGTYDGQNHTISNLYINRPSDNCVGLFGCLGNGTVKNLGVTNVSFTASSIIGGLVGYFYNASNITNCYSTGTVIAIGSYAGGLVGQFDGTGGASLITQSHSDCNVSGIGNIGGLIGHTSGSNIGDINNCYAAGTVTASGTDVAGMAGGLIPYMSTGTVSNCYATGSVTSNNGYSAGFISTNYGTINSCFASGTVTGKSFSAGFIGAIGSGSTVTNCYSTGSVTANTAGGDYIGGFSGNNLGTVTNCYTISSVTSSVTTKGGFTDYNPNGGIINANCFWNSEIYASGCYTNLGTFLAIGKTTAQMQTPSTFTSVSWSSSVWSMITGSYPKLIWETPVTQASAISFSSVTLTGMTISWTNGDASRRAVFAKEGSGSITNPNDNTTYTSSTNWSSKGTQLGSSGYYCVYNGTGTSVSLTNLAVATQYTIQIFEYDGAASAEKYLTTTATNNPANVTTASSTTWNGTTWNNGNPSSTIDAIIASSTAPSSSFACQNLTINSSYALNTTGITATVNGNITNNGNGISGTGTVTIAATSALSGTAFTLSGILNLSSGTFTTNSKLTIAPGGAITGTYANISGSVTLQQSIIAQRGFRVFANPFSTTQTIATVASNNGITINTSAQASGLTDSRTFSNSTNTWSNVTGTTWAGNTAYALFIRGKASEVTGLNYTGSGPSAFTYSVSGTLNGASTSITPISSSNFIVVGNPYAAPVNSKALTSQTTGKTYYVYQISQGGSQSAQRTIAGSWVASGTTSDATHTIPVLGVVAYTPPSTTLFNITTSDINTGGTLQTGLFGIEPPSSQLELLVEQNGDFRDKLFVKLDPSANATGTDNADLLKFYNDNVNVYTISTTDNTRMAIDARNVLSTIPLGISALAGDYNFKLANNNFPEGTTIYLNDKLLNTQTALKVGDVYNFTISSDAATHGEQRFSLSFSSKTTATTIDPTGSLTATVLGNVTSGNLIAVQIAGATGPVTIAIKDMSGRAIGNINAVNGIQYVNIGNTVSGMLLLQISDGKNSVTKKVIKL